MPLAHFRPKQDVIDPTLVNVEFCWHEVKVACEEDGHVQFQQFRSVILGLLNHRSLYWSFVPGAGLPLGK